MMMLARIAVVAKTLLLVYQANQITAEVTHEECAGQESFEAVNAQGLLQREKSELKVRKEEQKWGWLFGDWGKKEKPARRSRKPRRWRRRRTPEEEEEEEEEEEAGDEDEEEEEEEEEAEEEEEEEEAEEEAKETDESLYESLYGTGP
eukprot:TRINITY_DN3029_c0_g1_i1.p1 TRINITY_DN3029_c0_g1~~TRINITY_DN3029_c0_g1_i1.p1  ORF type:complete len:148 (+),score=62.24 TRINITY_DN3029_c0_g1_i1:76-519(+)